MELIRLGRTEAQVSRVSLGTWAYGGPATVQGRAVGWSGHQENAASAALLRAYELGISHWDTADSLF